MGCGFSSSNSSSGGDKDGGGGSGDDISSEKEGAIKGFIAGGARQEEGLFQNLSIFPITYKTIIMSERLRESRKYYQFVVETRSV